MYYWIIKGPSRVDYSPLLYPLNVHWISILIKKTRLTLRSGFFCHFYLKYKNGHIFTFFHHSYMKLHRSYMAVFPHENGLFETMKLMSLVFSIAAYYAILPLFYPFIENFFYLAWFGKTSSIVSKRPFSGLFCAGKWLCNFHVTCM